MTQPSNVDAAIAEKHLNAYGLHPKDTYHNDWTAVTTGMMIRQVFATEAVSEQDKDEIDRCYDVLANASTVDEVTRVNAQKLSDMVEVARATMNSDGEENAHKKSITTVNEPTEAGILAVRSIIAKPLDDLKPDYVAGLVDSSDPGIINTPGQGIFDSRDSEVIASPVPEMMSMADYGFECVYDNNFYLNSEEVLAHERELGMPPDFKDYFVTYLMSGEADKIKQCYERILRDNIGNDAGLATALNDIERGLDIVIKNQNTTDKQELFKDVLSQCQAESERIKTERGFGFMPQTPESNIQGVVTPKEGGPNVDFDELWERLNTKDHVPVHDDLTAEQVDQRLREMPGQDQPNTINKDQVDYADNMESMIQFKAAFEEVKRQALIAVKGSDTSRVVDEKIKELEKQINGINDAHILDQKKLCKVGDGLNKLNGYVHIGNKDEKKLRQFNKNIKAASELLMSNITGSKSEQRFVPKDKPNNENKVKLTDNDTKSSVQKEDERGRNRPK